MSNEGKNENNSEYVELNYDGKGLTELPIYDEKWGVANNISIRDNKIEKISTFDLPSNLMVFDIGNNPLKTIVGKFPAALRVLDLTNTEIDKLPELDISTGGLDLLDIRGTPIAKEKGLSNSFSLGRSDLTQLYYVPEPPVKTIEWVVQEFQRNLFTEDEIYEPYMRFVTTDSFDQRKEELIAKVRGNDNICRKLVGEGYIIGKIEESNYYITETLGDELLGLCIFKIKPSSIYIDVICSAVSNKGGGSRIIDIIMNYTNAHYNIKRIDLDSVFDSIGFYEKKGFKKCPDSALCPMAYERPKAGGKRSLLRKRTRKLRGTLTLFLRKRSKRTRRH
jgi:hypothetical protein